MINISIVQFAGLMGGGGETCHIEDKYDILQRSTTNPKMDFISMPLPSKVERIL